MAAPAPAAPITSLSAPYPAFGRVERLDPALDELLGADAAMEKLAEGFDWSEGPVWMPQQEQLIFSDVPLNIAYRWREGAGVDVFLQPSGLTGAPNGAREPGSNGLALDAQGRLLLAQHGDRRIARLDDSGHGFVTLADRFEGKRFNSPNDLCVDRRGNIYFTDPPYGLTNSSAKAELDFHGVYRIAPDGTVTLLARDIERPNGIGLSPDERTLYLANRVDSRPQLLSCELREDGSLGAVRLFFDGGPRQTAGLLGNFDGLEVDERGNIWATGPGGVLIFHPDGRHLGTLLTDRRTANCTFGGPQGTTLYITADDVLCRIETRVRMAPRR